MMPVVSASVAMGRHHRCRRGVTLTELMVTVAIAVLILAFAAPSFMEQIERQRLKSVNDELIQAMHLTRMETLSRNARGFVKPGSSATHTCYAFAINGSTTHTPPEGCHCERPESEPVCEHEEAKLLGVVRVPRSTGVTVTPVSDEKPFIYFNRVTGTIEIPVGDIGQTLPYSFAFRLKTSRGAEIITTLGTGGRPSSCQVGGTDLGMPKCPD
jgi:prepilin-type N-terminal cleavage/methylation domain-containing protein